MPIFKIARYQVRPEARDAVEQAMREYAKYIAFEMAGTTWVTYREPGAPDRYISIITAETEEADKRNRESPGTKSFVDALYPNVVGEVTFTDYESVASSEG